MSSESCAEPDKTKHRKSRGGCVTCRRRKVKCDETRPGCLRCQRAKRICEGYKSAQNWIFYTDTGRQSGQPQHLVCHRGGPSFVESLSDDSDEAFISAGDIKSFGRQLRRWQSALFTNLPPQVPADYVTKIMKHAHGCTWSQLLARHTDAEVEMIKELWATTMTNSPMLFYVNMYGFGLHYRNRVGYHSHKDEDLLHVSYQNKAIRLAVEEITRITKGLAEPSEEILITVMILASYAVDTSNLRAGNFEQTLKSDDNDPNTQHEKMLFWLVQRLGGLDKIQVPGMANLIYLHDLFKSAIHCRQTIFPLKDVSNFLSDVPITASQHLCYAVDPNLGYVLTCMQKLVSAIEHRTVNEQDHECFSDLMTARLEIQHRILNLPYGPYRTALLIFSDMHIFPLPPNSYVRERLAPLLQEQLETSEVHNVARLWMNFVTALATRGEQSDWFAQKAADAAVLPNPAGFSSVRNAMSSILWSETFLAPQTAALWAKIYMMTIGLSVDQAAKESAEEALVARRASSSTSRSWGLILAWGREYIVGPD